MSTLKALKQPVTKLLLSNILRPLRHFKGTFSHYFSSSLVNNYVRAVQTLGGPLIPCLPVSELFITKNSNTKRVLSMFTEKRFNTSRQPGFI